MTPLNILYVDDDDTHRTMVAEAIEGAGHTVTQAATATAALDLLRQARYDGIVTDYGMPDITGATVAQGSALHPGVTVCVVSDHDKNDMVGLPPGTLLMTKPFNVPLLLDVLTPR